MPVFHDLHEAVAARRAAGTVHRFGTERVGAPIARSHQILGVGANYRSPGSNAPVAQEPLVFSTAPNSLSGPYDPVHLPRDSTHTDWEVELGVVIARSHYLADDEEALAAIVGYVLVNVISELTFQKERGGQWLKGKSAPTFNPCGPWLVTPDDLGDTENPRPWLDHNGVRRQDGTTADMLLNAAGIRPSARNACVPLRTALWELRLPAEASGSIGTDKEIVSVS
ncbi:fumarylacetoacetate hydrolase family protein [Streptomyces niveus]|uniref:fumarylacetoacetate hydrolase family protein n=1 Tax=Streptomyces niveus TaxID=193462 RepID=UPI0036D430E5